jgi:hypothetical protein
MSLIETRYSHITGDEFVTETVETGSQTVEKVGHIPYHQLRLTDDDGQLTNDGTDTETIVVEVVNGLQRARGETPDGLSYTGDVTVAIDGAETTKTMTDGSVSFDITTSKPAGASIAVRAINLDNHPTDTDSVSIEVS